MAHSGDGPSSPAGRLLLLRHGETEWSRSGQHSGLTDLALTARGEVLARRARTLLEPFDVVQSFCSPLRRARQTAEIAGLAPSVDEDLVEWDYGGYEGLSTPQIRKQLGYPWSIFEDGVVPGRTPGETVEEVAARGARVLGRVLPLLSSGDVVLVGHGHCLRILAATFLRQEPRLAAQLLMEAPALSVLGFDRGTPAVEAWNRTIDLPD